MSILFKIINKYNLYQISNCLSLQKWTKCSKNSYEIARDPDILNILKKQNNVGGFTLLNFKIYYIAMVIKIGSSTATAKSLQSCPTLCDPIVGSPPGSPVLGILQARTLEWVAISFSNAGKWKVKGKSLSHVQPSATPWTAAFQAPPSMGFSRQEYWSGVNRIIEA